MSLSERMNMKLGKVEGAHVMRNLNTGFEAYDTLCLICADQDEDLSNITDEDFDSCSIVLDNFVKSMNESTGYTLSVWF